MSDPFIALSYALTLGGIVGALALAWVRMRRAERRRDEL